MKKLALLAAVLLLGVVAVSAHARTHAGAAPLVLTPGHASATIDKLLAAQTAGDVETMATMYTSSAVVWQNGNTYTGTAQIREHNKEAGPNAYRAKRISPVIVTGNVATIYERAGAAGMSWLALGVYQLQGGHVARSWEFILRGGLGSTRPFDKGLW